MVARVISVANQKGGVGKTTTALNLAVCLARAGCRTLLLDVDPQCNATSGLGLETLSEAQHPLLGPGRSWTCRPVPATDGLWMLPGSRALAGRESPFRTAALWAEVQHAARQRFADFEYVLVDCPPSLSWLTQWALGVSTEVLIPIQCEYYAMEGLSQMVELIQQERTQRRLPVNLGGIVLTMFDPSFDLTHEVAEEVASYFGDQVFHTVVPRDVALAEAPSHGLSVLDYAPRARATRAYVELCLEVMDRG